MVIGKTEEIKKNSEKEEIALFDMLDEYFNSNKKKENMDKIGFCLFYFEGANQENVPIVTNINNTGLEILFKFFYTKLEEMRKQEKGICENEK